MCILTYFVYSIVTSVKSYQDVRVGTRQAGKRVVVKKFESHHAFSLLLSFLMVREHQILNNSIQIIQIYLFQTPHLCISKTLYSFLWLL